MAITNQEHVGKVMDLLRAGLAPFVEREFKSSYQTKAGEEARRYFGDDRTVGKKPVAEWDVAALLKLMWEAWNEHVAVKQLLEDFARYIYLPRVAGPEVLLQAVRD